MSSSKKPRVLFYRDLRSLNSGSNGGNLKVRDAFDYFRESDLWNPKVCFSPETKWFPERPNLWTDLRDEGIPRLDPQPGDLLFFSGRDWLALPAAERRKPPVPVLNIAQPRHVRPEDGRREFLAHPALRIAKSAHGASILSEHGVNGPLVTIPDAIDLGALPQVPKQKDIDILILGLKQPTFGKQVYEGLSAWNEEMGLGLRLHLQLPPKLPTRNDFLELLARAKVVACIPLELERGGEGFYLPALEAMALQTLVVCPHSVGNLGHCIDGVNCIVPPFTPEGLIRGVKQMWEADSTWQQALRTAGRETAEAHDRPAEKRALLELADQAYDMWSSYPFSLPLPTDETTPQRRKWWQFFNR
ncbi:glycosyltransferase [Lewinella sp. 4G2]|uniref:glycosyltransferase n=1 Tax=Lewinella sp. 4G2 TaxID=1803372 RepID=UPI0007B4E36A|nr:glycosyltransferase [Lewinella sp. 4G2]OAV44834.1 hypothetical protein A3850_010180 [Lewinella sp. 4G2]